MTMTPRNFRTHVALTAQVEVPPVLSGAYESVGEFFAVALAAQGAQRFEPVPGNEWVRPGFAGAIAYRDPAADGDAFALAVYVEGDVTVYRFPRIEDAARAGRLWAAGLI
ncbi:hypothetical protein G3N18_15605 [Microbacterium sp. 2C]|uniref:hypothetical protein n=1 Tax=Microbacterium paulum TaxID=2707006 RepID=UPI0018C345A5|nr:hypothetical protein [Microbacterium paulum]MBG0719455.1 hypothetical protein [Microbacterium paulum]